MTYPGAGPHYSKAEKDWFDRIVQAFPRGFHVVQDINAEVSAEIRMVRIGRMRGDYPLMEISAPFGGKSFEWVLEEVSMQSDGSWKVLARAGTGLYRQRWTPLTDEQYRPLAEALDDEGFKPAEHWTGQGRAEEPSADSHGGSKTHEAKVLMKPGPAETREEFIARVKAALGIPPKPPRTSGRPERQID